MINFLFHRSSFTYLTAHSQTGMLISLEHTYNHVALLGQWLRVQGRL